MTRIIYILAASHSGSTLLAMLLGRHPELCTVGELKATSLGDVDRYRCSCGARIRECSFWRKVSEGMARRGFAYDVTDARTDFRSGMPPYVTKLMRPLHRGPVLEALRDAALECSAEWRRGRPAIQARNAALASTLLEITGKRAVVDSSKIGMRLKYLLQTPGLDVKVVRLIRDGRGVALAYIDPARFADARDPRLKGGGSGGDRANERQTMEQAARQWRRSNEEANAVLARLRPNQCIEVRYEDLCADTIGTLRRICHFVDIDPDLVSLDFRKTEHHVLGNGMRLDSTAAIELDERWKHSLSPSDLDVFGSIAGGLSRRLGYQ